MPYSANIPAPVQRTAAEGVTIGNTYLINSTGQGKPTMLADELKGGLHYVEYFQYLTENSYRGISVGRRRLGMLAFVHKNALLDAQGNYTGSDEEVNAYYKLDTLSEDGTVATWVKWTGNSSTLTPDRVFNTADIAGRDALLTNPAIVPAIKSGDIVVVANASGDTNEPGITGGATYIYSGTDWVRFLFPSDPDRHTKNQDSQLVYTKDTNTSYIVTAQQLYDHLQKTFVAINDASLDGETTSVYSSAKLFEVLGSYVRIPENGDGTTFLNDQGEFVEVQAKITTINGGSATSVF